MKQIIKDTVKIGVIALGIGVCALDIINNIEKYIKLKEFI